MQAKQCSTGSALFAGSKAVKRLHTVFGRFYGSCHYLCSVSLLVRFSMLPKIGRRLGNYTYSELSHENLYCSAVLFEDTGILIKVSTAYYLALHGSNEIFLSWKWGEQF